MVLDIHKGDYNILEVRKDIVYIESARDKVLIPVMVRVAEGHNEIMRGLTQNA